MTRSSESILHQLPEKKYLVCHGKPGLNLNIPYLIQLYIYHHKHKFLLLRNLLDCRETIRDFRYPLLSDFDKTYRQYHSIDAFQIHGHNSFVPDMTNDSNENAFCYMRGVLFHYHIPGQNPIHPNSLNFVSFSDNLAKYSNYQRYLFDMQKLHEQSILLSRSSYLGPIRIEIQYL